MLLLAHLFVEFEASTVKTLVRCSLSQDDDEDVNYRHIISTKDMLFCV